MWLFLMAKGVQTPKEAGIAEFRISLARPDKSRIPGASGKQGEGRLSAYRKSPHKLFGAGMGIGSPNASGGLQVRGSYVRKRR